MAKKQKLYKRLPGNRFHIFFPSALWAGPDHLLAINSRFFIENYKRFYYKDIQAIVTRKLEYWNLITLLLGISSCLFLLLAFFTGKTGAAVFGTLSSLFISGFLLHLFFSSTCECYIKTAVQMEKLPSLNRLRAMNKTISLIKPLIDDLQGKLTPEAINDNMSNISRKTNTFPTLNEANAVNKEKGNWHKVLFYLLFFAGIFYIADIFINHVALTLIGGVYSMGIVVFVIISTVKQYNSNITNGIRTLTWTTVGFVCIDFILSYIFFLAFVITNVDNTNAIHNNWLMIKMISEMSPMDNPYLMAFYLFVIISTLLIGLPGIFLVKKFQAENEFSSDIA